MLLKDFSTNFFWALVDRGGMLFFQFIALVYLSHLVTPYDFGLIAILGIFINLSNVLVDSGMVGALIKKRDVEEIDYNTLFTYNFSLSVTLYLVLFLCAPLIARFYGIPDLILFVRVLSLSIVINAFGLVQTVKLTRELKFRTQSIITVTSQVLTISISIFLAKLGYGVWSLIALQLLHFLFSAIMLSIVNKYRLKIEFSKKSFKEQFAFGGPLLLSNILFIINNNIYSSIIGKYYNAKDAGYFYQSNKLQNTPVGIVTAVIDKVGFTMLSKSQNVKDMIRTGHVLYKYIYLIAIPIFVYVIEVAEELFVFIFGNKWLISAPIFKILCYAIIPLIIKTLNRNLLKSSGQTKSILTLEVIITVVGILLLIYVVDKNLHWIAYSLVLNSLIIAIVSAFFVRVKLEYDLYSQFKIIIYPLVFSIVSLFIVKQLITHLSGSYIFLESLKLLLYVSFILTINFLTSKIILK